MITFIHGDIFEAKTQVITNTINTQGVMGKGLALEFKKRFPKMYADYTSRCGRGEVKPGEPYLYVHSTPWILNFPTKNFWRYPSRLEWVEKGLEIFVKEYAEWTIKSIAFAPLGCGLGKLHWPTVKALMVSYLEDLPVEIKIYEPPALQVREEPLINPLF